MEEYDFLVLGGGSAGYAAANTARGFCERVAIVDGSEELGGLCILRGCMPSKTLIYSAEVLHLAQMGEKFGLDIPTARADMKAVHARKRRMIDEFSEYRVSQLKSGRFSLYRQCGRLVANDTVELGDGTRLHSKHILISTGSVVHEPMIPGLAETPRLTSDEVLELDYLPERVVVLGGGIVACELAQYLRRMGSEVVQIQRSPRILKEASPEASETVMEVFRREGIELYTDTQLKEIRERDGGGVAVRFQHAGGTKEVTGTHLFNALGRRPATDNIGLECARIERSAGGHIVTNINQQTSCPTIYAAGDCTGPHEIVHLAVLQGEIAAYHAFGKTVDPIDYDALTLIIFTDPGVASAGLTEEQAKERGIDCVCADFPFNDHGKAILMEANDGYVKVIAERSTGKVLGAECVGKDAAELIHSMSVAVAQGMDVCQLLKVRW